jgi:hypothetical protein
MRQLSPFTIGVLPPLVLSNTPEEAGALTTLQNKLGELALEVENLFNIFLEGIEVPTVGVPEVTDEIPNSDLTPHFTLSMFAQGATVPSEFLPNIQTLAEQLEIAKGVFEEIVGGPVSITLAGGGGYRSRKKNEGMEGTADNSQHIKGKAADIKVSGIPPAQVTAIMNDLMNSGTIIQGGLGNYPTFTHYDIRGNVARWYSRKALKAKGEGNEISIGEAIQMLPPGPAPSELARLEEEAGYTAPLQRRTVPSAAPPSIPLLDVASQNDTWLDAKLFQERADLVAEGADIGGAASNRILAEAYIAGGLQQVDENGAFTEPGIADRLVAVDIASQLDTIQKAPPLTLLVNPASLSIAHARIHQFSQRTRNGFIYQAWGEEQPTISISGTIGAYIAGVLPDLTGLETTTPADPMGPATTTPTGVQFASKRNSASYQNLMALLGFYKHAGYVYDTVHKTNANHMVGALAIEYDQWTYIGHMNSFNWGHEETETVVTDPTPIDTASSLVSNLLSPFSSVEIGDPSPTTVSTGSRGVNPEDPPGEQGLRGTGLEPEDEDTPFCVVDPATGNVVGCFSSMDEALNVSLDVGEEISTFCFTDESGEIVCFESFDEAVEALPGLVG